jgi:hydrogenase maturation protease
METVVIGMGNRDRGDDGAGIAVARRLRAGRPLAAIVRECPGDALSLLDLWRGCGRAIVIDASAGCGAPGTVRRLEAGRGKGPLPAALGAPSSHSWGLADAVEMARRLGELPQHLVVYAIAGRSFEHGRALTGPVRAAVGRVTGRVRRDIAEAAP